MAFEFPVNNVTSLEGSIRIYVEAIITSNVTVIEGPFEVSTIREIKFS